MNKELIEALQKCTSEEETQDVVAGYISSLVSGNAYELHQQIKNAQDAVQELFDFLNDG
jgi:ribosomal protein S17E